MPTPSQLSIGLILLLWLALNVGCSSSETDTLTPEQIRIDASENNKFAIDLYKELSKRDGNFVFSPYSIHSALTMTSAGAAGTTAKEIAGTLHLEGEPAKIHAAQKALIKRLNLANSKRPFELCVANRLWALKGHPLLPAFKTTLRENYDAESELLDFGKNPGESAQKINNWSSEKTNGKIKDLVTATDFDQDTRLVLTNAVYFKSTWAAQFDANRTKPEAFYLTNDKSVKTPTMNLKSDFRMGHFRFGDDKQGKVLILPYKAYQLSMVIFLPSETHGLAELEKDITMENLTKWSTGLNKNEVNVSIPKFKMEHSVDLNESLKLLGIKAVFDESDGPNGADFSATDGTRQLYLSKVKQKAFIEVNEEGTEAAAATHVTETAKSAAISDVGYFNADHPFLFLIRDHETGTILFLGRVTNPSDGAQVE